MDELNLEDIIKNCVREDMPACSYQCPFLFDIRAFIEKIQKGAFDSAYTLYKKAVMFPHIVSRLCSAPCESSCFRNSIDTHVAISSLESVCCKLSKKDRKGSFYIQEKKKNILVVGAGLSGITASIRLSKRGYKVRLIEKNNNIGGRLWNLVESEMPKAVMLQELNQALDNKFITVETAQKAENPEDYEYDAMLIATGRDGDDFAASSLEKEGVFICGSLREPDIDHIGSIIQGMDIATEIDAYLQSAVPAKNAEVLSRYKPDMHDWERKERVLPDDINSLSDEEIKIKAKGEAERCTRCTCSACMGACEILPHYYKSPINAVVDVRATMYKNGMSTKRAQTFINSCTNCGACGNVCDYGVNISDITLYARRFLNRKNDMPPAFHEFWINDMYYSNSEEAAIVKIPRGRKSSGHVFFPGCQMAGSDPQYVLKTYRYLQELYKGDVAIFQYCCGIPALWAGREDDFDRTVNDINEYLTYLGNPVVILACSSCMSTFSEYFPNVKTKSLWEVLDENSDNLNGVEDESGSVFVFDPCSSDKHPKVRNNVRSLVKHAGISVDDTMHCCSGDNEIQKKSNDGCCGFGGLIFTTSSKLYKKTVNRAAEISPRDYVTYCVNCRDCFAGEGKGAYYILDLLFFDKNNRESRRDRKSPDISEKRKNKIKLKKLLLKEFWDEEFILPPQPHDELKLTFDDKLLEKMERTLILQDNVRNTIYHGLQSGTVVRNEIRKSYICHLRQGTLTYHAEFKEDGQGGYTVLNAYSHRVMIPE